MSQNYETIDYPSLYAPIQKSISNATQTAGNAIGGYMEMRAAKGEEERKKREAKDLNNKQNETLYGQIHDIFGHLHGANGVDLTSFEPQPDEPHTQWVERVTKTMPMIFDELQRRGVEPTELGQLISLPGVTYDQIKAYTTQSNVNKFKAEAKSKPQPVAPGSGLPGQVSAPQPIKVSNPATDDRRPDVESVVRRSENQTFDLTPPQNTKTGLQMPAPIAPQINTTIPQTPGKNSPAGASGFPQSFEEMQANTLNEPPPIPLDRPEYTSRDWQNLASQYNVENEKLPQEMITQKQGQEAAESFVPGQSISTYYAGIGKEQGGIPEDAKTIGQARVAEDAAARAKATEEERIRHDKATEATADYRAKHPPMSNVIPVPPEAKGQIDSDAQDIHDGKQTYADVLHKYSLGGNRSGAPAKIAQLDAKLREMDPTFDRQQNAQQAANAKDPTFRRTLVNAASLIDRMDIATQALNAYSKGDTKLFNKLALNFGVQTGDPKAVVAKVNQFLVADEAQKIIGSGRGGEKTLEMTHQLADPSLSSEQVVALMKTVRGYIAARRTEMMNSMGPFAKLYAKDYDSPAGSSGQQPATPAAEHPEANQALQWAQAHPNDPMAAEILKRLGK
jgi:hypothetical protein